MVREQDLAAALRAELAAVEPARACCRRAERAGLGMAATGRARSAGVARLAVRLDADRAAVDTFDWHRAEEHCRVAWLRGCFLARGSLSLTPSGTHLEFVLPIVEAPALVERLLEMGLPGSWRVRRGQGVVTWKGRETVLVFLRRAGASASTLELESVAVTRALHGDLNRVLNAENANLRRTVLSAVRQVTAIEALERSGRLRGLPAHLRLVADVRRRAPESTLSELAALSGITRPRVQRALERLESLADEHPVGSGVG